MYKPSTNRNPSPAMTQSNVRLLVLAPDCSSAADCASEPGARPPTSGFATLDMVPEVRRWDGQNTALVITRGCRQNLKRKRRRTSGEGGGRRQYRQSYVSPRPDRRRSICSPPWCESSV